jgi:hypothetical protein
MGSSRPAGPKPRSTDRIRWCVKHGSNEMGRWGPARIWLRSPVRRRLAFGRVAPVQPSVRVVSKRDWPPVCAASGWPLEPPAARRATAPLPRPGMRNANTPAVAGHVAWAWWPCLSTNLPCAEINQRPSLIRSRVRTRAQVKSRMRLHHATPGLIIRVRDMGSFVPRVALPTCHMSRIRRLMLYQCHPLSDYRLM